MGRTHRRNVFDTLGYSGYVMIEEKERFVLLQCFTCWKPSTRQVFCPKSKCSVCLWAPSVEITCSHNLNIHELTKNAWSFKFRQMIWPGCLWATKMTKSGYFCDHAFKGEAVRNYVMGYGSQIAIFGTEMTETRNRQSCA